MSRRRQRSLTYEALAEETSAVANALAELGIEAGDRIALYLPNSVTFVTTYFGAVKRGVIPVPVNMRLQREGIEYVLGDAGARAVVTTGQFEDLFADMTVDGLEHLVVVNGSEGHQYSSLVEAADTEHSVYPRRGDELLGLMYTSGTTGRPKGVKQTHRNMETNSHAMNLCMGWSRHDVGFTVNPCFHVSGLNVTLAPLLLARAENYLIPAWDPEDALAVIEERVVTTTFCIMTIAIDLLNCESAGDYDTSSLRTFGAGGSPMPSDQIEAFEQKFDCRLLEGYGMTETTANGAINRFDQDVRKPGSVGPPAKEVIDLRIEDPEARAQVDGGDRGELLWRGDIVTTGYYNMPEKNQEAFVEREGEQWLRSGDIGRLDEDGHLFVEDQVDDMIISGGKNVYPSGVEDVLYEIDGVQEAAVLGTPHDRLGEMVTAVVVCSDESITAESLEQQCREHLAEYELPRRVEFTDEMPKTSTRKIDKASLRDSLE
jgi:acyl-CoA synthetase (AMP-forming)/AMP-acid ligase II